MLEDLADGFALIVGAVSSLSDLLEDDVFDLGETLCADGHCRALKTPRLQNSRDEVVLLVDWGDSVAVSVVADETLFSNVAILGLLAHDLHEIVHDSLGALLARRHSGVCWCVVLRAKGLEGNTWSTLCKLLPSLFDDS